MQTIEQLSIFDQIKKQTDDKTNQANGLLQYLVNRVVAFNPKKIDTLLVSLTDDTEGLIAYNLLHIVAQFVNVKIYTHFKTKPFYWHWKNIKVKRVRTRRRWNSLKEKPKTFYLNISLDGSTSSVYYGITREQLEMIREFIYGI